MTYQPCIFQVIFISNCNDRNLMTLPMVFESFQELFCLEQTVLIGNGKHLKVIFWKIILERQKLFTRNMTSAQELHLLGSLLAPIIEVSWSQEELKEPVLGLLRDKCGFIFGSSTWDFLPGLHQTTSQKGHLCPLHPAESENIIIMEVFNVSVIQIYIQNKTMFTGSSIYARITLSDKNSLITKMLLLL